MMNSRWKDPHCGVPRRANGAILRLKEKTVDPAWGGTGDLTGVLKK
ncbi:MAG: hypothetical protein M0P22_08395 [Methanoculleus sp.]|nr:hypothetical protein [Methanoculleus sp.]